MNEESNPNVASQPGPSQGPNEHHIYLLRRAHQQIKQQDGELRHHRARTSVLDLVEQLLNARGGGSMMGAEPGAAWEIEKYLREHDKKAEARAADKATVEKMVDNL